MQEKYKKVFQILIHINWVELIHLLIICFNFLFLSSLETNLEVWGSIMYVHCSDDVCLRRETYNSVICWLITAWILMCYKEDYVLQT